MNLECQYQCRECLVQGGGGGGGGGGGWGGGGGGGRWSLCALVVRVDQSVLGDMHTMDFKRCPLKVYRSFLILSFYNVPICMVVLVAL